MPFQSGQRMTMIQKVVIPHNFNLQWQSSANIMVTFTTEIVTSNAAVMAP